MIAHREADSLGALLDQDLDVAAERRKFDRVRQQVGDNLGKTVRIGRHLAASRIRIEPHAHGKSVGIAAIGVDHLLDQRAHIDPLEIEDDFAGFDLFDVEDVVDEPHQPLAVGLRDGEEPQRRLGQRSGGAADQQPERAGNRGQRRAQLVAHGRDEFVLEPVDALALADVDNDAEHEQGAAGVDRIEPDLDREFGRIAPQSEQFAVGLDAPGLHTKREHGALLQIFAAQPRWHQDVGRPAYQLLTAVAEHPLRFGIHQHDDAGAVGHHHAARAGLDRQAEFLSGETLRRKMACRIGDAENPCHHRSGRADAAARTDPAPQPGMMG